MTGFEIRSGVVVVSMMFVRGQLIYAIGIEDV